MQHVEVSQWFPHPPQVIYDFLTNPDSLAKVVGRIASAKVMERGENEGSLAVVLEMPARQKIKTVGEVKGIPNEHLTFKTEAPFPLAFSWQFTAHEQQEMAGTTVLSALDFDLSAFGLPMGGLMIRGLVQGELQADLQRLTEALAALS